MTRDNPCRRSHERRARAAGVWSQEIERIDLVHDHLTVDVRLRPGPPVPVVPAQRKDKQATTTGTPPADAAAAGGADEVANRAFAVDGASGDSRDAPGRHTTGLDQTE